MVKDKDEIKRYPANYYKILRRPHNNTAKRLMKPPREARILKHKTDDLNWLN